MAKEQDMRERDDVSGTETTGHEWDGIKELDTPLPRWWLWTFYATIVWSFFYVIAYPAIPLISSATSGFLGYSSRAEVAGEIDEARQAQAGMLGRIEEASLQEIHDDAELAQFAVAGGRSAFAVNCVQCHGSGAQGFPGYPNLNDDEWLWGGSLDEIFATLQNGIRFEENDDTHYSQMPAFATDDILSREEIGAVADHVLLLAGRGEGSPEGAELYLDNCSACHGEAGDGDRSQGAPALNDAIWLYGGDQQTIVESISKSRFGVMPAWGHRLDAATLKQLAVYVHALGGGE